MTEAARHPDSDPGYYLPEEAQYRLQQLCDHMRFLARLAQPRTLDEERDAAPKVRAAELAVCMELLAEQMDMVLREVSWPAQRQSPPSGQDLGGDLIAASTVGRGVRWSLHPLPWA